MSLQAIAQLLGGFLLLMAGAQALVRGSSALAKRMGISPLVIGLTIVALGTSAPELVVGIRAALGDQGGLAVGSVVGSNIANLLLVLGLSGLIRPLTLEARIVRFEIPLMIVVLALVPLVLLNGSVSRFEGFGLVAGLAIYLGFTVRAARREANAAVKEEYESAIAEWPATPTGQMVSVVVGLVCLSVGADWFVAGGSALAAVAGLSEAFIGLTVVALGTSLPELMTSLVAASRGDNDIAVGNVVGSNLFNVLGNLGASAIARPLVVTGIVFSDHAVMLFAGLLLLPMARSGMRLNRPESGLLLAGYIGYIAFRLYRATISGV